MKNRPKIIQICGIKGILTALFIVTCLAAGFIAFPGYVAMTIWNHFTTGITPAINLYQGILLWAIVAIIYFIATKQRFAVSFGAPKELNEEELKVLMERVKMQSQARMINKMMLKEFEEVKKEELSNENKSSENETITK